MQHQCYFCVGVMMYQWVSSVLGSNKQWVISAPFWFQCYRGRMLQRQSKGCTHTISFYHQSWWLSIPFWKLFYLWQTSLSLVSVFIAVPELFKKWVSLYCMLYDSLTSGQLRPNVLNKEFAPNWYNIFQWCTLCRDSKNSWIIRHNWKLMFCIKQMQVVAKPIDWIVCVSVLQKNQDTPTCFNYINYRIHLPNQTEGWPKA